MDDVWRINSFIKIFFNKTSFWRIEMWYVPLRVQHEKIANRKRGEDRRTEEEKKLEGEGVRKGERGSGNQKATEWRTKRHVNKPREKGTTLGWEGKKKKGWEIQWNIDCKNLNKKAREPKNATENEQVSEERRQRTGDWNKENEREKERMGKRKREETSE